ncbi:hypothetical protein KKA00_12755, partial [bacterium]|nr:hypothetical protein [bacterium]
MQLMKILEIVNQWERNSFLKILEQLAKENRKSHPNAEKIIALADGQIKNAEDREIGKLFTYLRNPYKEFLEKRLNNNPKQLDILVDIVMRDGNSFMSREWFSQLYERELKKLKSDIKAYNDDIQQDSAYQEGNRLRDYRIYQECLKTAYKNDDKGNRDRQVTGDEWSILNTLSVNLELSNQEIRWIDYSILNLEKADIDVLLT